MRDAHEHRHSRVAMWLLKSTHRPGRSSLQGRQKAQPDSSPDSAPDSARVVRLRRTALFVGDLRAMEGKEVQRALRSPRETKDPAATTRAKSTPQVGCTVLARCNSTRELVWCGAAWRRVELCHHTCADVRQPLSATAPMYVRCQVVRTTLKIGGMTLQQFHGEARAEFAHTLRACACSLFLFTEPSGFGVGYEWVAATADALRGHQRFARERDRHARMSCYHLSPRDHSLQAHIMVAGGLAQTRIVIVAATAGSVVVDCEVVSHVLRCPHLAAVQLLLLPFPTPPCREEPGRAAVVSARAALGPSRTPCNIAGETGEERMPINTEDAHSPCISLVVTDSAARYFLFGMLRSSCALSSAPVPRFLGCGAG